MLNNITYFLDWLWDAIINFIYSAIQLGCVLVFLLILTFGVMVLYYSFKPTHREDDNNVGQADE